MAEWHIITPEYPPQLGGVSDYTRLVAGGLARAGDDVHVWTPRTPAARPVLAGVMLHDMPAIFSRSGLRRVGKALDAHPAPRRLLVQWVPHGYGYRSVNIGFCLWLLRRARMGDVVDLMVHEVYLPFGGSPLQSAAALMHRLMAVILLRAATRVWYAIPAWERRWRPYALGRDIRGAWLPVPSNVPVELDTAAIQSVRESYATSGGPLLGSFGTFGRDVRALLLRILTSLSKAAPTFDVLLIGPQGEEAAAELLQKRPDLAGRVHSTGLLPADAVGPHIDACDLLVQPYTDGVSSRRGSFMAGLAHGRPMVTTLGFLSEPFWESSGAALFAAPEDTASLAGATERLLTDPAARERIGATAAELYRDRFDISRVIEALRGS
jgi:glycosyltransferase involved in cell wall biosynthesis